MSIAATVFVLAAEEGAPSNPILPEISELIWGTISFTVLVFLMWKFAFPPVKAAMEGRTERIRNSLDDAERAKSDAQQVLDEYQRQLNDARSESARIIDEARQAAESMRRDLLARAEAEVSELRAGSEATIQAAQQRAMEDLRSQVRLLAIELAEVVVQKNLDRDTNTALIESYINQVGTK